MAIAERDTVLLNNETRFPRGARVEFIDLGDGEVHRLTIVSFRDARHADIVAEQLAQDKAIAFHGWGVSGMGCRADNSADSRKFWLYKNGRPAGSKIPLLEPPTDAVEHIDWQSVHKDFRYLRNPRLLGKLWDPAIPFHIIFPYKTAGKTLDEAVVTPAYDREVAPHTPVPTICLFWVEDPALRHLINKVKKLRPEAQIAVSSLNDSGETPPFNTPELVQYLRSKAKTHWNVIVEDPLLEPLDIASSHSQFVAPLEGEEPVWVMKRRGSISAKGFSQHTGFQVKVTEGARLASRRAGENVVLDDKLYKAAELIHSWHRGRYLRLLGSSFEDLKERLHIV